MWRDRSRFDPLSTIRCRLYVEALFLSKIINRNERWEAEEETEPSAIPVTRVFSCTDATHVTVHELDSKEVADPRLTVTSQKRRKFKGQRNSRKENWMQALHFHNNSGM